MTKKCTKCKRVKPLQDFYTRQSKCGYRSACIECEKDKIKEYYANNAEQKAQRIQYAKGYYKENCTHLKSIRRSNGLKTRYNLTPAQYEELLREQQNKCAICKKGFTSVKETHVDHNHKTGQVRGILCRGCNHLLGNAKDDTDTLKNAIAYLQNEQEVKA